MNHAQGPELSLHIVDGTLRRVWKLGTNATGLGLIEDGPMKGRVVVALADGPIMTADVNNDVLQPLVVLPNTVTKILVSCKGTKLALIDQSGSLSVVSLETHAVTSVSRGVTSASFNENHDEIMAYTTEEHLYIRTASFSPHRIRSLGPLLRFKGSDVTIVVDGGPQLLEVHHSVGVNSYIAASEWAEALQIAQLGVTDNDWQNLATAAAAALELKEAASAYRHMGDEQGLALISAIESALLGGSSTDLCTARVLAYQGRVQEAAARFGAAGEHEEAISMFNEHCMFDEAAEYSAAHSEQLAADEASRLLAKLAALMKREEHASACDLMALQGWWPRLVEYCMRQVPRTDETILKAAAASLSAAKLPADAEAVLNRIQDKKALVELYLQQQRWDEALAAAAVQPALLPVVSLPMARWYFSNGQIDKARLAFREAGAAEEANTMLLSRLAVSTGARRFALAASLHQDLAMDALSEAGRKESETQSQQGSQRGPAFWMARFALHFGSAEDFTALALLVRSQEDLQFDAHPATLFSAARFLLLRLLQAEHGGSAADGGVDWALVLRTVAEAGAAAGAHRLARFAWSKLRSLPDLPEEWQEDIKAGHRNSKGLPITDEEELLPVCFRCGATNNLAGYQGDACADCGEAFLRSFVTYDHLPVVAFALAPGLSHPEAMRLLAQPPTTQQAEGHPFGRPLHDIEGPLIADRLALQRMERQQVAVRQWPGSRSPPDLYFLVDTSVPLKFADDGRCYEEDELALWTEESGHAPFHCPPSDAKMRSSGQMLKAIPNDNATISPRRSVNEFQGWHSTDTTQLSAQFNSKLVVIQ